MQCQLLRRIPEMKRNLRKVYRRATSAEIAAGVDWYPAARRIVAEWSAHYRFHDTTVACVIAALSPQVSWETNLIVADDLLAMRAPSIGGCLNENIRKAIILRDQSGDVLNNCARVRMENVFPYGVKVQNFAANLAGSDYALTIDGHAAQAALNDVTFTNGLHPVRYNILADVYADVAAGTPYKPAAFQAITWLTWKRLYPAADKRAIKRNGGR